MLNKIEIENFGPLTKLDWRNLGPVNLIIGGNGTGKTFLLKASYSAMRTVEEYRRGDDRRTAAEILAEKLYWTFQPDKIGDLVTKNSDGALSYTMRFDDQDFIYGFGKDTTKQISSLENHVPPRASNSIFLPAKEVLSLHQIILKSREQDKAFGFDDTYLDLARALRQSPNRGKNFAEFAESRQSLEEILGGRVEYDETSGRWQFKKGNQKFQIGVTAEGVKKIAILDTLLGNRYLDTRSIVFIDEPESALHPMAVSTLLDIVAMLAERGIQFFLASHSYFVVKKLFLIAQEQNLSIPVISAHDRQWTSENLQDGIPENPIINESIRLYKEEVGLALK
ncbi:MAG: AAA family ATPase [Magnetococcales bacterium]|nr:AAA family ATPase [Magnetococcales bacterium]MBF0148419.1 AAA family ATPase [Magnetococcales bacterium]MBF0173044.1 AAA family ATPase [Magnetococcales bacterium]MBF0632671.1 AAA family ATPase [Magnetococcales bacterium]